MKKAKTKLLKRRFYNAEEIEILLEQARKCANIQIREGTATESFLNAMGQLQIYLRDLGVED